MSSRKETEALSDRLGYRFSNIDLLETALTHSSLTHTQKTDNQRLEFLGDRILGLVVAEALFLHDGAAREGQLAPRLNALVRKETCAEVAEQVDLGSAVRMGRSEMQSGGRRKTALLGDAMEAVIAAIYLDADYQAAKNVVLRLWGERISRAETRAHEPKSALQEWAQARKLSPPQYVELARTGPDHAPVFVIEARLENGQTAKAEANSKKAAQTLAAQALLNIVEAE